MKKRQKIFLITSAITGVIIVFVTCAIAIFNVDEKIQTLASIGGTQTKELLADGDNTEELINNQLIETALMQSGFGYFILPGNNIKEYTEEEIRKLFFEIEGVVDPGEKPKLESITYKAADDTVPGKTAYYAKAFYTYRGRTVESKPIKVGFFIGNVADQKEAEARESIQENFDAALRDYERYIEQLNSWTGNGKNFQSQYPDGNFDSYTNFWIKVAEKVLGTSFVGEDGNFKDNESKMTFKSMLEKIVKESKGENILDGYIGGKELSDEIKDIVNSSKEENQKPDGGGDTSGGGSSGGSGGGSTSGGGSSGGSGGGNTSGGEGEKPEEPVDKVAPSISKVSVTSPSSGNYREGQEIKIKVEFDKNIYGTEKKIVINKNTAPKLFIKFGVGGENKLTTFDSANGKAINYSYKIQKEDTGKLEIGSGDNFIGTVYNESGVKADLTKIEKLEETKEIVADNLGPSVQKIEAISEAGEYKIGDKIEIKVSFNEKIYGTKDKTPIIDETAPILQIYFGEGNKKETTYKSYDNTDNSLIYEYTITHEDRGELKVDVEESFTMKEIYDEIGNVTQLIKGKELTGNVIKANSGLTQITFDKKEITLDLNGMKTAQINATISSNNKKLTWETADKNIAIVDETGKVTGIAIGETTIIAKAEDGAQASCKVTVKDTTNGNTKVKLNRERLELDLNGTKEEKLIATVEPKEMEITWSSSDKNIATVDETGKVVAISTGETQIIAKAKDGTTAICTVIVTNSNKNEIEPTSIETNIKNIQVVLGRTQTLQLKTTIIPSNSNKNTKVTYKSSDENIATVDETGKVTIKAKGTVVITATTANGKKAYSTIEVIEIETGSNLKIGDINSDNNLDTTDLLLILRHMAVMSSEEISTKHQDWILKNEKFLLGDINANGIIDITDALKIQRHMAASKSETIQTNHPDWIIQTNW